MVNYERAAFQQICRVGDVREFLETVQTMRCSDVLYEYDFWGRQPTHMIAEYDEVHAMAKIEILVKMGADINARELVLGNKLLHIAVTTRNYALAEWICREPGANLGIINFMHETAYHIAYKSEDLTMMELLRINGSVCDDPTEESDDASVVFSKSRNNKGENLLHYLCHHGDVNDLLIFHDVINDENRQCLVDFNQEKQQCVHIVASEHKDAVVKFKLLARWGADINAKELNGGNTPLHIAVEVKNYALVEWLSKQPNINRDTLNNDLMTPYHIALMNMDEKMIDLLKQNEAQSRIPLQSEANSSDKEYEPKRKSAKYSM